MCPYEIHRRLPFTLSNYNTVSLLSEHFICRALSSSYICHLSLFLHQRGVQQGAAKACKRAPGSITTSTHLFRPTKSTSHHRLYYSRSLLWARETGGPHLATQRQRPTFTLKAPCFVLPHTDLTHHDGRQTPEKEQGIGIQCSKSTTRECSYKEGAGETTDR